MEPLVSIVMANYNSGRYLKDTMDSVMSQTYQNFEFIIVDDASTDDSIDILTEYAAKDPRIRLYRLKKNSNICIACNQGLSKVKGKYIARMDSDDIWSPEKLEKQIAYLEKHPACGACFTLLDVIDEDGNISNARQQGIFQLFDQKNRSQKEWIRTLFYDGNCLAQPSAVFQTEVIKTVGGYHPAYLQLQDYHMWLRITARYPIYVLEERLMKYRREEKSATSLSSAGIEKENRRFNEDVMIHRDFLDYLDEETFLRCFQEDFRCPDSNTALELECEKAFILCRPFYRSEEFSWLGMERLASLLQQEESRLLLEEKYDFTVKDYYMLTKQGCFDRSFISVHYAQGSIYFDAGQGFSENNKLLIKGKERNGKLVYQEKIEIPKKTKAVRFDPLEGEPCFLLNLTAESDKGIVEFHPVNAIPFQGGWMMGDGDPQILLKPQPDSQTIFLTAELQIPKDNQGDNLKAACKQMTAAAVKNKKNEELLIAKEKHIENLKLILATEQEQLEALKAELQCRRDT